MPTAENVNTYIQDVNKGGESDEEMAEMNMEEIDLTEVEQARGPDRSPEKKKKRKREGEGGMASTIEGMEAGGEVEMEEEELDQI